VGKKMKFVLVLVTGLVGVWSAMAEHPVAPLNESPIIKNYQWRLSLLISWGFFAHTKHPLMPLPQTPTPILSMSEKEPLSGAVWSAGDNFFGAFSLLVVHYRLGQGELIGGERLGRRESCPARH